MSGKMVLVVEDDSDVRESMRLILEIEGYKVLTADNGQAAISILNEAAQRSTWPCLIILDLMMPIMNGWEFLDVVTKDDTMSGIPVVLTTAYADKGRLTTVKDVMRKPVDLDRLLETVKSYCP